MSSVSVCQGIQSCQEPRQANHLKLKPQFQKWVQSPCISSPNSLEMCGKGDGGTRSTPPSHGKEPGGWSSIYSLCDPSQSPLSSNIHAPPPRPPPSAYTKRPLVGKKSLELCTETLGCETGAAYSVGDFNAIPTSPKCDGDGLEAVFKCHARDLPLGKISKRKNPPSVFPPPLTTLRSQGRLRMVSSREDGRLLLVPTRPPLLQVQRTEGRLCLRLLSVKAFGAKDEAGTGQMYSKAQVDDKDSSGDGNEKDGEEEEGNYLGIVGKEMNEIGLNGGSGEEENGMGKYPRTGGCKEEEAGGRNSTGKGKLTVNWESLWVTSS